MSPLPLPLSCMTLLFFRQAQVGSQRSVLLNMQPNKADALLVGWHWNVSWRPVKNTTAILNERQKGRKITHNQHKDHKKQLQTTASAPASECLCLSPVVWIHIAMGLVVIRCNNGFSLAVVPRAVSGGMVFPHRMPSIPVACLHPTCHTA